MKHKAVMANRTVTFPENLRRRIMAGARRDLRTFNKHVVYLIKLGIEAERKSTQKAG